MWLIVTQIHAYRRDQLGPKVLRSQITHTNLYVQGTIARGKHGHVGGDLQRIIA